MIVLAAGCAVTAQRAVQVDTAGRQRLSMDFDWKFRLGHASDKDKDFDYWGGDPSGAAKSGDTAGPPHSRFDDSDWEVVDVPHDWCVGVGFDKSADSYHAYKKIGRDWPETSIGWYRKTFEIPAGDLGKRLTIEFDGVFRDCQVWLNAIRRWKSLAG